MTLYFRSFVNLFSKYNLSFIIYFIVSFSDIWRFLCLFYLYVTAMMHY